MRWNADLQEALTHAQKRHLAAGDIERAEEQLDRLYYASDMSPATYKRHYERIVQAEMAREEER